MYAKVELIPMRSDRGQCSRQKAEEQIQEEQDAQRMMQAGYMCTKFGLSHQHAELIIWKKNRS